MSSLTIKGNLHGPSYRIRITYRFEIVKWLHLTVRFLFISVALFCGTHYYFKFVWHVYVEVRRIKISNASWKSSSVLSCVPCHFGYRFLSAACWTGAPPKRQLPWLLTLRPSQSHGRPCRDSRCVISLECEEVHRLLECRSVRNVLCVATAFAAAACARRLLCLTHFLLFHVCFCPSTSHSFVILVNLRTF